MDPKDFPRSTSKFDALLDVARRFRDEKALHLARYEFIRNCTDEHQLDAISNALGDADALDDLIDALIKEAA